MREKPALLHWSRGSSAPINRRSSRQALPPRIHPFNQQQRTSEQRGALETYPGPTGGGYTSPVQQAGEPEWNLSEFYAPTYYERGNFIRKFGKKRRYLIDKYLSAFLSLATLFNMMQKSIHVPGRKRCSLWHITRASYAGDIN